MRTQAQGLGLHTHRSVIGTDAYVNFSVFRKTILCLDVIHQLAVTFYRNIRWHVKRHARCRALDLRLWTRYNIARFLIRAIRAVCPVTIPPIAIQIGCHTTAGMITHRGVTRTLFWVPAAELCP